MEAREANVVKSTVDREQSTGRVPRRADLWGIASLLTFGSNLIVHHQCILRARMEGLCFIRRGSPRTVDCRLSTVDF